MKSIADALVYAVTYVSLVGLKEDSYRNDDVGALESIAAILNSSTEEEKDALAAAADRALANELGSIPRDEFVRDYRTWMEDMFGEEWEGNTRRH